jgi:hypothetical protein
VVAQKFRDSRWVIQSALSQGQQEPGLTPIRPQRERLRQWSKSCLDLPMVKQQLAGLEIYLGGISCGVGHLLEHLLPFRSST